MGSNKFASTSVMKNCNNFSTITCSYLSKKSTNAKRLIGSSWISVWICKLVLNSLKRYYKLRWLISYISTRSMDYIRTRSMDYISTRNMDYISTICWRFFFKIKLVSFPLLDIYKRSFRNLLLISIVHILN